MFTDGPTTPLRVEILVDLLRSEGPLDRKSLGDLLQPAYEKKAITEQTITAALQLQLISEDGKDYSYCGPEGDTRETVRHSFDQTVLASRETEPYLAGFYAYLLGGGASVESKAAETQVKKFVEKMHLKNATNPFNKTKQGSLSRWFVWAGLGWDFNNAFTCNPFERIRRSLGPIFADEASLEIDDFVTRLGQTCPELDGGAIYRDVWPEWNMNKKKFSLGVSHALIDLHQIGDLIVTALADARGWSIGDAAPPNDGKTLQADKVDRIEWKGGHQ